MKAKKKKNPLTLTNSVSHSILIVQTNKFFIFLFQTLHLLCEENNLSTFFCKWNKEHKKKIFYAKHEVDIGYFLFAIEEKRQIIDTVVVFY